MNYNTRFGLSCLSASVVQLNKKLACKSLTTETLRHREVGFQLVSDFGVLHNLS
jgi:hypothetical protein